MDKKPKILCIGSILWDIIGYSITPLARGDDKEGIISRQPGGAVSYTHLTLPTKA